MNYREQLSSMQDLTIGTSSKLRFQLKMAWKEAPAMKEERLQSLIASTMKLAESKIRSGYATRYLLVPGMTCEEEAIELVGRLAQHSIVARVAQVDYTWQIELDFNELMLEVEAEKCVEGCESNAKELTVAERLAEAMVQPQIDQVVATITAEKSIDSPSSKVESMLPPAIRKMLPTGSTFHRNANGVVTITASNMYAVMNIEYQLQQEKMGFVTTENDGIWTIRITQE